MGVTITVWCARGFTFESEEAAKAYSGGETVFERQAIRIAGNIYLMTGPVNVYNDKLEIVCR